MMNRGCSVGCSGVFGLFVALLVLGTPAIKLTWEWIVPEVFPGAVSQDLVAGSITWLTALKLAIVAAVLLARSRPLADRERTAVGRRTCDIQSPNGGSR